MAVNATTTTPLYIYFITGNQYKLLNRAFYYDLRKYYFSARVVNMEQFAELCCGCQYYNVIRRLFGYNK